MNTMKLPGYGAVELKAEYNRNLGFALGIAVVLHIAFIGLYLVLKGSTAIGTDPIINNFIPVIAPPVVIDDAHRDAASRESPGGSGAAGAGQSEATGVIGTQEIAGDIIVPNPDDSLVSKFASLGNLSTALPVFGDNPGTKDPLAPSNGLPRINKPAGTFHSEDNIHPDDFVAVEQLPVFDIAELQRNLKYPELARRSGIEGTIVVRVLIDRKGNATKTMIDASDNVVLERAAADAVLATTFTPALQNNVPTAVWMQVPVVFLLR